MDGIQQRFPMEGDFVLEGHLAMSTDTLVYVIGRKGGGLLLASVG